MPSCFCQILALTGEPIQAIRCNSHGDTQIVGAAHLLTVCVPRQEHGMEARVASDAAHDTEVPQAPTMQVKLQAVVH